MAKVHPIQTSFNAGEWDDWLHGRVDIAKYKSCVHTMLNWVPLVQGPATVRAGTYYVAEVKDSSEPVRLVRFEFSTVQAYVLEFGDQYIRFYRDQGQIEVGPGSPYEIATPWALADLPALTFAQSADELYVMHPAYQTRVVSRTGHTAWTISTFDFQDGPYLDVNSTATTLGLSGTTGSVTVTASSALFAATDVGRLIRWEDPANNWTWLEITAFSSSTQVTATIMGADASATTATADWRLGLWSDTTGWPVSSTFFDGRQWFGGGVTYPHAYAGSVSDDFTNFAVSDPDGTVTDDAAIMRFLNGGQVNAIEWLADADKGLAIGTAGGVWLLSAGGTTEEVLKSTNLKQKRVQTHGCADVAPLRIDNAVLYVQVNQKALRELAYVFEKDGYGSPNLSIFNQSALKSGIVELAWQESPTPYVLQLCTDGTLVKQLYDREQDTVGMARVVVGGTDAVIESVTTIPATAGTHDEVWVSVRRTINGATFRSVEYFEKDWEAGDTHETAHYIDCGLSYSGSATTTVSGLDHLEGETVSILADGAVRPQAVVASGAISLVSAASNIHVGLAYTADLKLARQEAGAQDGTAQGKVKETR